MKLLRGLLLLSVFPIVSWAQGGALVLSASSSVNPLTLDVTWVPQGSGASAVQWTIQYPASSVASITVTAGPALTVAQKEMLCSAAAGAYRCVVAGMNKSALSAGVIARVTLTATVGSNLTVGLINMLGSSAEGNSVPVTGASLVLAVGAAVPQLSSLTCSPGSLTGAGTVICVVTLSGVAPSGGTRVTLSDNSGSLTTPGTVTVGTGSTTGTFSVTAAAVTTNTTATVTASLSGVTRSASITLTPVPASLTSLSCNPTSISGAGSSTCVVTLSKAAPSGGTRVTLSDNSGSLTTPGTVTVGSGLTTGTFSVTAAAVTTNTTATVTASLSGVTRTASITLTPPPALSSIQCNPSSVVSGASSVCSVILTNPAPAGNLVVTLSDTSANTTTPSSVTIPQTSTSANFTVTTSGVSSTTSVTITAAYAGVSKATTLTLTASARPSLTSLQCNPVTVLSWGSITCSVTLSAAAPAGGLAVSLSEESPDLALPASITVPSGSISASLSTAVATVANDQSVTIRATLNGVSKTVTLTIVGNGLLGWWKLDETTGSVALDSSGSGNHGLLMGTPAWTSGVSVGALQLNRSSYVQVPDSPSIRAAGHAISFGGWYYQSSDATGYLLGKAAYMLSVNQAAQRFAVDMITGDEARSLLVPIPGGVQRYNNTWVHLFATYDGSVIRAYLNGELQASLAATGDLLPNTAPFSLGDYGGYGSWVKFGSRIDDLRVYRRVLNSTEVRNLYLRPGQLQ